MIMDISKLRIFVNLVETQNFTRTAQNLNLTQPSVSYIIKTIEDEVGQQLFIRNKRHVVPTRNGMIFYNQIKPLINKYYSAIQSIRDNEKEEANIINIGCSVTPYHIKAIPVWIKKFSLMYPKVRFNVTILDHNKLKRYLENEDIDLFLTSKGDASDLKNITFYPLVEDKFFAIIPNSNPLANEKELALSAFSGQNMIFVDNDLAGVEMIDQQNQIIKVNKNLKITYTNDLSGTLILVNALQGITIGLKFIYTKSEEQLAYVAIKNSPSVTYGAVINKKNDRQIVKIFIKFIQKKLL